jgi:hypothetical protein
MNRIRMYRVQSNSVRSWSDVDNLYFYGAGCFYNKLDLKTSTEDYLGCFTDGLLTFFSESYENNNYVFSVDSEWYCFENGEMVKSSNPEQYRYLGYTEYEDVREGRSIVLCHSDVVRRSDDTLIEFGPDEKFIMNSEKKIYCVRRKKDGYIVCKDLAQNELNRVNLNNDYIVKILGCVGGKLFYEEYLKKERSYYIVAFDLNAFIEMDRYKVELGCAEVFKNNDDIYLIASAGFFIFRNDLFIHIDLGGKQISDSLVNDNSIYLSFEGEPYLYAYEHKTIQMIKKKRITFDCFTPRWFRKVGEYNLSHFIPKKENRMEYFGVWKDEDFLSDEEFEIEVEEAIYKKSELTENDLFSVQFEIDGSADTPVLMRQTIACIEDAIACHTRLSFEDFPDVPEVQKFDGNFKIVFRNSNGIEDLIKKDLLAGIADVERSYKLTHAAWAGGNSNKISIDVDFIG